MTGASLAKTLLGEKLLKTHEDQNSNLVNDALHFLLMCYVYVYERALLHNSVGII